MSKEYFIYGVSDTGKRHIIPRRWSLPAALTASTMYHNTPLCGAWMDFDKHERSPDMNTICKRCQKVIDALAEETTLLGTQQGGKS